jgi:hypothetical protein
VTGGDVVGVVKENGPFGVRVLWWFLRTPSWAINVQRQMSYLERVQFPTVVLAGCVNLRCWGWCITHARRKTGMGPWNPASWILLLGCKAGLILWNLAWESVLGSLFWGICSLECLFLTCSNLLRNLYYGWIPWWPACRPFVCLRRVSNGVVYQKT